MNNTSWSSSGGGYSSTFANNPCPPPATNWRITDMPSGLDRTFTAPTTTYRTTEASRTVFQPVNPTPHFTASNPSAFNPPSFNPPPSYFSSSYITPRPANFQPPDLSHFVPKMPPMKFSTPDFPTFKPPSIEHIPYSFPQDKSRYGGFQPGELSYPAPKLPPITFTGSEVRQFTPPKFTPSNFEPSFTNARSPGFQPDDLTRFLPKAPPVSLKPHEYQFPAPKQTREADPFMRSYLDSANRALKIDHSVAFKPETYGRPLRSEFLDWRGPPSPYDGRPLFTRTEKLLFENIHKFGRAIQVDFSDRTFKFPAAPTGDQQFVPYNAGNTGQRTSNANILQERIIIDLSQVNRSGNQFSSMPLTGYLVLEKTRDLGFGASRIDPLSYGSNRNINDLRSNDLSMCMPAAFQDHGALEPVIKIDAIARMLSNPRVQGSLQAFSGLIETGVGGAVTLGTAGIGGVLGGGVVMAHGLDQAITGIKMAFMGTPQSSATSQLLQKAGVPGQIATGIDHTASIVGSMGATAAIRVNQVANFPIYQLPTVTRWNPVYGLGRLEKDVVKTFRTMTYVERFTKEPIVLYRVFGGKSKEFGDYWTRIPPAGPLQSKIDSALLPKWGNTADKIVKIKVPSRTTIYEGFSASQQGLIGGGNQIYIKNVDPSWMIE